MNPQSLDLSGITKTFGPDTVLSEINLAVRPGEFLSLVGMSGCGKSTLLRIIAGLEAPTRGTVLIGERDVTEADPSDRNLAMVFQSYALYPHMSVRENIATPLRMRRLRLVDRLPVLGRLLPDRTGVKAEIAVEVARVADLLEIGHLLDRKPAQLSGGQRQRVALARAIVRSPAAFLMDEPLSNLDAKLRAHMREELTALHRRLGATFVYVTHDQVEAMTMSDRIALMSGGRIEQLGTPTELYETPATLTVARFIGTPSINLLPAEIAASGRVSAVGTELDLYTQPGHAGAATLGVRAEDLMPAMSGLEARIVRSEMHGADRFLTCELSVEPTVRVVLRQRAGEPTGAETDGRLRLGFASARVHLFDADGRRRETAALARVAA
jgi:multiple sugar transport system ATP-binding protein